MKTEYQKQKQRNKRKAKSEIKAMVWQKETQELENFLYENDLYERAEQFSPYHFRVIGKMTVDIWAGSKKYFIHGMSGSACYDKINELKKYLI